MNALIVSPCRLANWYIYRAIIRRGLNYLKLLTRHYISQYLVTHREQVAGPEKGPTFDHPFSW